MEQEESTSMEKSNEDNQENVVKSEPIAEPLAEPIESDDEPSDDFLDELLNSAGDIAAACAATRRNSTDVKSEQSTNANDANDEIDPSFFDDILSTKRTERRLPGATRNHLRLKREHVDLEDGEVDDEVECTAEYTLNVDSKKKNKKSKKAKRKKSKDEQRSPQKSTKERVENKISSPTATAAAAPENIRPRLQVRAEFRSFCPPARSRSPTPEEPDSNQTTIETHIGSACSLPFAPFQLTVGPEEPVEQKPETILTPEEKLSKSLERVKLAKYVFLKAKQQKEKLFYPNDPVFAYTPTVRKLPTSFSHFTQHVYDNRSPLHTVNNVTFEFNSMATRLNLEEWGLESLPSKSKVVARILAYDVDTLFAKKQLIKIPDKIQKPSENTSKAEDRELCEPSNSTLYMNVMVQTEAVKVIPLRRRDFYRDKGIQFTPTTNITGTQTNSMYTGHGTDLPLFRVIRQLNENQLEALDDFIQFMREPTGNSGMDLYQQRKRLSEIYATSQIPATVSSSSPSFKRSAEEAGLEEEAPSPPPPRFFDNHDDLKKRESSRSHPHSRKESRWSNPPQSRSIHSQPISRYNGTADDGPSSSSVKFYGRGGHRR